MQTPTHQPSAPAARPGTRPRRLAMLAALGACLTLLPGCFDKDGGPDAVKPGPGGTPTPATAAAMPDLPKPASPAPIRELALPVNPPGAVPERGTLLRSNLRAVDATSLPQIVADQKGKKAVLVNFWATWCAPCVKEFPEIVALQKKYPDTLQVVFVSCDFEDGLDQTTAFLKKQGVDWTTYFKSDETQEFFHVLHNDWDGALPATMIFGVNGEPVTFFAEEADTATFETHLQRAFDMKSPNP